MSFFYKKWWAWMELNHRQKDYESSALTPELQALNCSIMSCNNITTIIIILFTTHN